MQYFTHNYLPTVEKGIKNMSDDVLLIKYSYRHEYNDKVRKLVEKEVEERGLIEILKNS